MITIPEDASPADVMGETAVLPGQDWLSRSRVLDFAQAIASGTFDWETSQQNEPMYEVQYKVIEAVCPYRRRPTRNGNESRAACLGLQPDSVLERGE